MKVGKQDNAFTAICTSDMHTINVRGKELAGELIGRIGFSAYFFFLVTGQVPDGRQQRLLDAVLVAIAEHGLVPSNQAARMTLAAAPRCHAGCRGGRHPGMRVGRARQHRDLRAFPGGDRRAH